ncbi:hypothetical protein A2V54_03700 [candidate division WWE3 bacterium RBG_19FT_COMBO_53_11]|uniref:Uncharacterized protein n=1 Tax=candidate division WWE3 bacterium RBG_19FT_COMBO_53_11 TaxID=1802613 RepID=A0A1F4UI72_UNCKA|nr:MAG: hypothetical protein A2155_01575 [candidate division WWE3 bacterium RBG_16_52_45]OGC44572.1 MAG: hypothetical protein A2V54_03700 [candidate division WWE3 bacterium RBG_19FT_COMBO_53_11]
MKIFFLWSEDDHAEAIRIAKRALSIAQKTIAKQASAANAEIDSLNAAVARAEVLSEQLSERLKKVSSAAKDL